MIAQIIIILTTRPQASQLLPTGRHSHGTLFYLSAEAGFLNFVSYWWSWPLGARSILKHKTITSMNLPILCPCKQTKNRTKQTNCTRQKDCSSCLVSELKTSSSVYQQCRSLACWEDEFCVALDVHYSRNMVRG